MKIALILRCAAWLTPGDARAEWLAEWGGELAYVRSTCGRARAMAFCLGAFRDALWLRQNQLPAESLSPASGTFSIESPTRCLAFLAVLAAASAFFAFLPSGVSDELWPRSYRDAEKLAMISRRPGVTPRFAEITVDEYGASANRIPGAVGVAFYAPVPVRMHSKVMWVAVASPNLFDLLGLSATAQGLILSRRAWRRYFAGDPHLVGRKVQIGEAPVVVAGIVSDDVWQLPGLADAWLLDSKRLAALRPRSKGFMVARLRTAASPANFSWPMSARNERGNFDTIGMAPLPHVHVILGIFMIIAASFLVLTSLGLGEYPANGNSPALVIRIRRWMFLVVKIALVWPIVFFGFLALGVLPVIPGVAMLCVAFALRWALQDQRSRCPVCLHSLSHPVRIGDASNMFLAWYGTELLCTRGHGLLHVPEIRTSCYAEQRWLYLDPSWTG